jgi:hypothetical protein
MLVILCANDSWCTPKKATEMIYECVNNGIVSAMELSTMCWDMKRIFLEEKKHPSILP